MTSLPIPILCLSCVRLRDAEHGACEAFPAGIPDAIWESGGDHRQPVSGDQGLRFKLKPGREQALADWRRFDRLRSDDPFGPTDPIPEGEGRGKAQPQSEGRHFIGGRHPRDPKGQWTELGPGGVKSKVPAKALPTSGGVLDELDDFDIDPDVGLPKPKGPVKAQPKPKGPTKINPKSRPKPVDDDVEIEDDLSPVVSFTDDPGDFDAPPLDLGAPPPPIDFTDADTLDEPPMDLGAPPDLQPPKPKNTASHRYGRETVDRFNRVERGQDHTDLLPDWERDRVEKLESNYSWWDDLPPDKQQAVRDLVADTSRKPTYIRMFPYGLGQTVRDGRMKNVHETRSKDDRYIDQRGDYENAVMGLGDTADRDKPIYGYIGDIETADAYGPVAVKLKPSVRERTTATVGDSLNGLTQPYGVDQMPDLTDDQLLANIYGGVNVQNYLPRGAIWDYMEAQIHGGVDLDDIDSVTVDLEPGDTLEDMFEPATLAALRERGIPIITNQ